MQFKEDKIDYLKMMVEADQKAWDELWKGKTEYKSKWIRSGVECLKTENGSKNF